MAMSLVGSTHLFIDSTVSHTPQCVLCFGEDTHPTCRARDGWLRRRLENCYILSLLLQRWPPTTLSLDDLAVALWFFFGIFDAIRGDLVSQLLV